MNFNIKNSINSNNQTKNFNSNATNGSTAISAETVHLYGQQKPKYKITENDIQNIILQLQGLPSIELLIVGSDNKDQGNALAQNLRQSGFLVQVDLTGAVMPKLNDPITINNNKIIFDPDA